MSSPPLTTDLQLYLRSDAGTFTDTAGSTPATSDGDNVKRWNDQITGGIYLFQGGSNLWPTLQTNEINSTMPCVRFDGSDDFMSLSHKLTMIKGTMYAVIKIPSTSVYTLLCGGGATPATDNGLQWRMDNRKQRFVQTSIADIGSGSTQISTGTWSQINASWDLTNGIFRTNAASDANVTGSSQGYYPFHVFGKNPSGPGSEFFASDIALLLLYFGIHTLTEKQSVESWITSEFGV